MTAQASAVVVSQNVVKIVQIGIKGPPGPPGPAAPVLMGTFFAQSAANLTVPFISSSRYAFTIASLNNLRTSSGNITVSIQINGVNVTGLSNLNVTSTPQNPVSTANNVVNIGDRVTVVLSGGTIASGLEFTMGGAMN